MSSSTSVRQGLQSCPEAGVMESHVLRLKLTPPLSLSQQKSIKNDEIHKDADVEGGWSFLLNKTEDSHSQPQNVYVHPTMKKPYSSMLSNKSLEMCTESLGCETGTITNNIACNMDEIGLLSLESGKRQTQEASRSKRRSSSSRSFPPPLTSMRDMGGVRVIRSHRKDGRLILKLEATPSSHPFFEAERSNGRLRLRLFQSTFTTTPHESHNIEEQVCGDEDEAEEEEELEGNNENVEDEMGKRKLATPRRCNESGNRNNAMPNWEPFSCVATT